jgi:hypothetical protein
MPPRPKGSLDDLTVPKGGDATSVAPANSGPAIQGPKNYAHTLSLRLTADQYRRLRRYVARVEDEGQGRVTHQSVIEAALAEYMERQGG